MPPTLAAPSAGCHGSCDVSGRAAMAVAVVFAVSAPAHAGGDAAAWCSAAQELSRAALEPLRRDVDAHFSDPPQPLPRLHTEGTLPHQGSYDESVAAKKDLARMRRLAL